MSKTLQALISETNTAIDRLKGNNAFAQAPIDYQAQALQTLYDNQVAPLMQQSAPDVTPEELAADRQAFIERHLMPSPEQQQVDAAYPTIDPMFRQGMQTTQQLAQQQSNPFTDFARGLGSEVTEQASWGGLDALPAPQSTAGTAGQIAGGLFGGLVNTGAGAGLGLAAALGLAPFTGGASLAALPWFVGGGAALGAGTGAYSRDIRQQQDEGRTDFNYGRALAQGGGGVVGSLIPGMGAGITGKLLGVGADALVNAGTDTASQYVDRGKIDWRQVGTAGAFGAGGRVAGELGQLAGQAIMKGRNNRLEQALAAQRELQRVRGAQQLRSGMVPVNIPQRVTVQGRQGLAVRGYETMPTRVRPTTKDKLPSMQSKPDVAGNYRRAMSEKLADLKAKAIEQHEQGNTNQARFYERQISDQMKREQKRGNTELAQEYAAALDEIKQEKTRISKDRKKRQDKVGLKGVETPQTETAAGGSKTEQAQSTSADNTQVGEDQTATPQGEATPEQIAEARRKRAGISSGQTAEKGVVFNRDNAGEALNAQTESAGLGSAQDAKTIYYGVGKNTRNLDPENRAKFNKLDENTREILRTEFDTSTGLGRQRDPGDLQGAQPKKLTQVSPDAISRLPKDKQDWVNAVDYAMKGDQAITLDYAAEGGLSGKGGATKAQDATKRDAVTPLYWVETKNGDLTFFGTNSDGHMAQYYLDAPPARDAIDFGDGDIPRSQMLAEPRPSTAAPYRGTYPNIYQGARTYELADVLNRGPRGEGIKTSYAKDILERAKLSGDILPEDLQQALKYDRSLDTVRAVRKYMAQNPATPKQVLNAFDRIATKTAAGKKLTALEVDALRQAIEKAPTLETLQAGCKLFGLRIE